jgi:hypothetical protein
VLVALADNQHQGIVPVRAKLGNGDDPRNNLYWGAMYGVRTYLQRQGEWRRLGCNKPKDPAVLERCVFRHTSEQIFLLADAYRGREIRRAVEDFLASAAGRKIKLPAAATSYAQLDGKADLAVYVGHNGLMDFSLESTPKAVDDKKRDAVVLGCISRDYFLKPLRRAGARPLLLTTGLMAPEAYILAALLDGWIRNEAGPAIRERAAEAYHRYQKCGLSAARRLFVSPG